MATKKTAKILKETDKDFSGKTERTIEFLEHYVANGDAQEAWVAVGNAETSKHLAMKKVRDNWRLVEKLIRNRIGSHVPLALNGVLELAENAKQEAVRLKALQDILYRAGYDRPMEIVTSEKKADDLSNKELDEELTKLLARVNNSSTDQDKTEVH